MNHSVTSHPADGATYAATRSLGHRICYGIALGGLISSLWVCVDATAVAAWGRRISWTVPVMLVGAYLVAGCIGGGLVAVCQALIIARRKDEARSPLDGVRHGVLVACAGVVAMMFVERIVSGGYEVSFGRSFGLLAVGVGLGGGAVVMLATTRLGINWGSPSLFAWKAVCLLLSCILWKPFSELYVAPVLSMAGLAANTAFVGLAVLVYLVGRRVAQRVRWDIRLDTTRHCLRSTYYVLNYGMLLSYALLWLGTPGPYESTRLASEDGASFATRDRSNVILIVMDTVRADHLSLYGYERDTTPNLARFARESVVYRNAIAPSSWTIPSHASMFTGLMPSEHGARISANVPDGDERVFPRLAPEYETLAEVMSAGGYETAAIVANLTLSRQAGMSQGFHYYDNRERIALDTAMCRTLSPAQWMVKAYQRYVLDFDPTGDVYDFCRNAGEITSLTREWLEENGRKPFFLFVNYMDAHNPFHPHPEFAEQLGRTRHDDQRASGAPVHTSIPVELRADADNYDAEIAYVDAQLGVLLDFLAQSGRFEDTLVIVTSDHGEAFGEHGQTGHCKSLFGEEIHVPLIIRYPNGKRQSIVTEFTSLASLMPLVLDHVGIAGGDDDRPTSGATESFVLSELRRSPYESIIRALHTQDALKTITGMLDGRQRLYDLRADPLETVDLAPGRPEFARWASEWLDRWAAEAHGRKRSTENTFVLDDDMLQKLRTLGYVE